MIELPDRIDNAHTYGEQHGCTVLAERAVKAWRGGMTETPTTNDRHAAVLLAILRGDVVPTKSEGR